MEHLLQKSKCSIFNTIFKYMIFQRRQKALLWSKGLILKHRKTESLTQLVICDEGDGLVGLLDLTIYSDFIWDFGKLSLPSHLGKFLEDFGKINPKIHKIGKI